MIPQEFANISRSSTLGFSNMPSTPTSNGNLHASPLAPLVFGVTGNTDPAGYDPEAIEPAQMAPQIRSIYQQIWELLDWVYGVSTTSLSPYQLQDDASTAEPPTGIRANALTFGQELAHSLGLSRRKRHPVFGTTLAIGQTPVVLLSSLAPGIDTIVAEAFLEYGRQNQRDIFVRAPVPFPMTDNGQDVLRNCTSYRDPKDRTRFHRLINKLRAQPGWDEDRDLYCVRLDNDWEPLKPLPITPQQKTVHSLAERSLLKPLSPKVDLDGQSAFITTTSNGQTASKMEDRRNLRYRAAGEAVALYSHLLIAVYDHNFDDESIPNPSTGWGLKSFNPFKPGTASIVKAKREGLSWELLATTNNFSWADNGPVFRLGINRKKRQQSQTPTTADPSPTAWCVLHPIDLQTGHDSNKSKLGDFVFRQIIDLKVRFNRDLAKSPPKDDQDELLNLLVDQPRGKTTAEKITEIETKVGTDHWQSLLKLAPAAGLRRRASDLVTYGYDGRHFFTQLSLLILIFIAAISLGMFEHWHRSDHHGTTAEPTKPHAAAEPRDQPVAAHRTVVIRQVSNPIDAHDAGHEPKKPSDQHSNASPLADTKDVIQPWIRASLLLIAITSVVSSFVWFWFYRRSNIEQKRFDYRAVSEALRVQIYWAVAGLNRAVATDYMQRQKDELDWIRYVVSDLTFPTEYWSDRFRQAALPAKTHLLDTVRKQWVDSQETHFGKKIKEFSHKCHLTHVYAWGLALAGLLQLPLMCVDQVSPRSSVWLTEHHGSIFLWTSLVGLIGLVCLFLSHLELLVTTNNRFRRWTPQFLKHLAKGFEERYGEHIYRRVDNYESTNLFGPLINFVQLIGLAIFVAGLVMVSAHYLPKLGQNFPDHHNWWIISTGACLLSGALLLAWGERSFHAEHLRNYCSMRFLFKAANRKLRNLTDDLEAINKDPKGPIVEERLIHEAQDIIYQLGCEALNENAEWLILHRSRPLEPFMPG